MMRNWLGQCAAFAVLLGFLFAATSPGPSFTFDRLLGTYVCHAQGEPYAALPGEDAPKSDDCCLICQVAQLANGTVLFQQIVFPIGSAVQACMPASARTAVQGEAAYYTQARAPPAA